MSSEIGASSTVSGALTWKILVDSVVRQQGVTSIRRSSESVGLCEKGVMTVIAEDLAAPTNVDGNTAQTIALRLREHLRKVAEQRLRVTYQEVVKALGLMPPNAWTPADPRADHLQAKVRKAVQQGEREDVGRRAMFQRVWELAHAACGRTAPASS